MQIISAKISLFHLINLAGISLSWIPFEESNICISSRTCPFKTKLKKNVDVFSCSENIVRILGWFHFTIAFKVGFVELVVIRFLNTRCDYVIPSDFDLSFEAFLKI